MSLGTFACFSRSSLSVIITWLFLITSSCGSNLCGEMDSLSETLLRVLFSISVSCTVSSFAKKLELEPELILSDLK